MLEKLCTAGRLYMKEMDLEDMAALKFCLLSMGMLFGIAIPLKWRKPAVFFGSALFIGTYLPLMVKLLDCLQRAEEET